MQKSLASMGQSKSISELQQAQQAAHLATHAVDQVAATILLHQLRTLWTGLGVCRQPVVRLAVVHALLPPLVPPAWVGHAR